jgi:ribonuclease-3
MAMVGEMVTYFLTGSDDRVAAKRISSDLTELENRIGYHFKSRAYLEQALTHISAVKAPVSADAYYERLEFLGDRVLGLAIAELLYRNFPHEAEGVLSRRLARKSLKAGA